MSLTTPPLVTPVKTIAAKAPHAAFSTPSKPTPNLKNPSSSTPSTPTTSRLLYRGALSLPDSFLLLDGLTFTAYLESSGDPSHSASKSKLDINLLQSPLALALESMRGRPSLRLVDTIKLRDVYLDETGGVEMDIHPMAVLSRIYFENMFCLLPFPTSKDGISGRSEIGIKVALGDTDDSETTEIVIFPHLVSTNPDKIRLRVARLCQRPNPQRRIPRPDDPIPRKPPVFFIREQLKKSSSLTNVEDGRQLKRVGSTDHVPGPRPSKRTKLVSGVRFTANSDIFKVPELPAPRQESTVTINSSKGKAKEKDVFGEVSEVARVPSMKSKQKALESQITGIDENSLEKANKNVVKRATIEYLEKTKDPTGNYINKEHADFKELYNFIQRGVGFALRSKMRTCTLDLRVVDRLVDMHALMYLGGCGGSAQMLW